MIKHELKDDVRTDRGLMGGVILVTIGAVMLIGQFANSAFTGTLILPALAAIFLAWGIATHRSGPLVPAGIFTGLTLGTWLVMSDWVSQNASDEAQGGIFLLAFAVGWASISVLSAIFTEEIHWWPLIPGGIMALIGTALLIGGTALQALAWLGYIWPLGLVAVGLYLLLRRANERQ